MIDPASTKTATNRDLRLLECEFRDADTHLLDTLEDMYIGANSTQNHDTPTYLGRNNEELDASISVAEVFAAAQTSRKIRRLDRTK